MSATAPFSAVQGARFSVALARDAMDIIESQRLRYRIFAGELGAQIHDGGSGLDHDRLDVFCRHLLVRDTVTGTMVASTRLLSDHQAEQAGGFYAAKEFDLEMTRSLPGRVLEVGRTCVHAEYRNGVVIAALWQGIATLIAEEGFDYLFGCASIGLDDGGAHAHAMLDAIRLRHMAPQRHRVTPYQPLPRADHAVADVAIAPPRVPPLLKAYLSLGAKACGEPFWDRDFQCADIFMLLNVSELNPRYARHFLERAKGTAGKRLAT